MKRSLFALLALSLSFSTMGCDDDDDAAGGGGGTSDGTANEVAATVEGGDNAGNVEGASETTQPGMYHAAVANGELVVSLASAGGDLVFFRVDTEQATVPSQVPVSRSLEGSAYLTYTVGAGLINEGASGSIQIDNCPNDVGTVVTGRFNNIGLINVMTEGDNGVLSGSFRATVAGSDGSAVCSAVVDPEPGEDGPSPGAACSNPACEGPCCPYIIPISTCQTSCMMEVCQDPMQMMNCGTCLNDCVVDSGLPEDAACMDVLVPLNTCAEENRCEDAQIFSEDACLAAHCCAEYTAAF